MSFHSNAGPLAQCCPWRNNVFKTDSSSGMFSVSEIQALPTVQCSPNAISSVKPFLVLFDRQITSLPWILSLWRALRCHTCQGTLIRVIPHTCIGLASPPVLKDRYHKTGCRFLVSYSILLRLDLRGRHRCCYSFYNSLSSKWPLTHPVSLLHIRHLLFLPCASWTWMHANDHCLWNCFSGQPLIFQVDLISVQVQGTHIFLCRDLPAVGIKLHC